MLGQLFPNSEVYLWNSRFFSLRHGQIFGAKNALIFDIENRRQSPRFFIHTAYCNRVFFSRLFFQAYCDSKNAHYAMGQRLLNIVTSGVAGDIFLSYNLVNRQWRLVPE